MPRSDNESRVTLSLLDRLTDHEPDVRREPRASRLQSLRGLKASVWRDLNALLNTKRRENEVPDGYPECSDSLLNFGLPDFTALSLKDPSHQNRLRRALEATIRKFEPRLISVVVTVEPRREGDLALRFHVEALLKMEPEPEPISFDTILEADTCHFSVAGDV